MIKKISVVIFYVFILPIVTFCSAPRSLPMETALSHVSYDKIYRLSGFQKRYKQMNTSCAPSHSSTWKDFYEKKVWYIGTITKIDDDFFINVKTTVRILEEIPISTAYDGLLPLLVPLLINVSQAQNIVWHSKRNKTIAALDDNNSLYYIDVDGFDYTSIGIPKPKIITVFKESSIDQKADFFQAIFKIQKDRNYLSFMKKISLSTQTVTKWFTKEEIIIDVSSIKALKNCQQNNTHCFMTMKNQDTGKKTVFEIAQIIGDPTQLTPNDHMSESPHDTNTNQQTTEIENTQPTQKLVVPIEPNKTSPHQQYKIGLILFGGSLISAMAALCYCWYYKNLYVL